MTHAHVLKKARTTLMARFSILTLATLFALVILPPLAWLYLLLFTLTVLYLVPRVLPAQRLPASHPLVLLASQVATAARLPAPTVYLTRATPLPTVSITHMPFTSPRLRLDATASQLEESELRAVLAHEMGHVASRDSLDQILWVPAFFAALLCGEMLCASFLTTSHHLSALAQHTHSVGDSVNALIFVFFAAAFLVTPLALLLALSRAHSRRSELCADQYALRHVPRATLLSALEHLTPAHSFTTSGRFDSHPSLSTRQKALLPDPSPDLPSDPDLHQEST